MAKTRLKKGRLFMTFALTVGIIVAADCLRRDFFVHPDNTIIVTGSFKNSQASAQADSSEATMLGSNGLPSDQSTTGISYLGYSELDVPASQLSSGLLAVIDAAHPAGTDNQPITVSLSDVKNECYSLRNNELALDSSAANALNLMMSDYNAATGLSDFIVYSTNQPYMGEDSVCPVSFPESASGFTVDLAVQGFNRVLEYDGNDEEAWVIENSSKYGFIVRYPQGKEGSTGQPGCVWHLRYVGEVHSAIMSQNGFCLEEYLNWLKAYTIDNPLTYQLNGISYEIYYTAYMGDSTPVRVPVSGNYTISGNNIDGFIVTALK